MLYLNKFIKEHVYKQWQALEDLYKVEKLTLFTINKIVI
jgi:hypothetical protein